MSSQLRRRASFSEPPSVPAPPWWRFGMVWLVISGPAVVVVAGIFTAVLAVRGADPVLSVEAPRSEVAGTLAPALQARNHAATPPAAVSLPEPAQPAGPAGLRPQGR